MIKLGCDHFGLPVPDARIERATNAASRANRGEGLSENDHAL